MEIERGPWGERLAVLHLVSADGTLDRRVTTSAWVEVTGPAGGLLVPRVVDLALRDDPEAPAPAFQVTYRIREIQIDRPFPRETFHLDRSSAPIVWDEDARAYLKHPSTEIFFDRILHQIQHP